MAIGNRIRFFRNLRGLKQKELGTALGFTAATSEVRMTQYESEVRVPKKDLVEKMAAVMDVSPEAILVPNIDSYTGIMHTLFALEDMYGLKIAELDGELCLRLDKSHGKDYQHLFEMFWAWQQEAHKLQAEEITKEEYDQWRYQYPKLDGTQRRATVLSEALSDDLVKILSEDTD